MYKTYRNLEEEGEEGVYICWRDQLSLWLFAWAMEIHTGIATNRKDFSD